MNLDRTLTALADRHRRQIVDRLREGPARAGELADSVGLSPPATSRHLKHLRQEGLIEATADPGDARARIYRLVRDPFAELRAWVDHVEGLWADQLDAFAAHVERTRRGEQP